MKGYLLSPMAVADLSDIWDYTEREWGQKQAERYVLNIRDACENLASGHQKGRSAEHIRAGYRRQIVGAHVLFFRLTVDGFIDIVRILHQRMDLATHLDSDPAA